MPPRKKKVYKLNQLYRPIFLYGRRVWSPTFYTYKTLRKHTHLLNSAMHKLTPGLDTWLFTDRWPVMYKHKHFNKSNKINKENKSNGTKQNNIPSSKT